MPLDVLAATPDTLRALLARLPDAITSAPADEGWSAHDVVAHLASLDPLTLVGRVRAIIDEDQPVLVGIDEHDVLERSGLRERPLAEILDEMERTRAAALVWLRELTPADAEQNGAAR